MITEHVTGKHGHRFHIARTPSGYVIVVGEDRVVPGPIFDRRTSAPPAELVTMAFRPLVAGERLIPLKSDYNGRRTRDVWLVRKHHD